MADHIHQPNGRTTTGKIVAISTSTRRGIPKSNRNEVLLIENWGMEGDVHAGNWHRQISILAMESVQKMRDKGVPVRPGAFAENLTTEFIDIPNLTIGTRVIIGDTELEITQIGKECHQKCAIFYRAGDCVMPREGIFAIVKRGGVITVGDDVVVHAAESAEGLSTEASEAA
ncbi:MOSC domain-containing protein [bacterium]|nr:MOSC domain-containing protein [bacterium]